MDLVKFLLLFQTPKQIQTYETKICIGLVSTFHRYYSNRVQCLYANIIVVLVPHPYRFRPTIMRSAGADTKLAYRVSYYRVLYYRVSIKRIPSKCLWRWCEETGHVL